MPCPLKSLLLITFLLKHDCLMNCLLNSLLLMTLLVTISHFGQSQSLLLITFLVKSVFFNDSYIEISLLMSFLLHCLFLMTLLDKISTCNAFPIENHTDHQKQRTYKLKVYSKNSQLKSRPLTLSLEFYP